MFVASEEQIRGCAVFAGARDDTVSALLAVAAPQDYGRNKQIYSQGDDSNDFHLVVSGTVRAKGFSPEGKEVTYGDIGAGELFGEFAAIDNIPRSSGVVAVSDVQALKFPARSLCDAIASDGSVALALIRQLVQKNRLQTDRIYEFSVLAVRQRVQQELLRLASGSGGGNGNGGGNGSNGNADGTAIVVDIPTHQELANRLSTHREAITRELRFLTKQGVIKADRNRVEIVDPQRLSLIAGNLRVE